MSRNVIFILAEGDHDSAFIYRILQANEATTDNRKIKDFAFPLNSLFTNGILNISIDDLNIREAGSRFLPFRVMQKENNTFLLYTIGGDSQTEKRKSILKTITAFNSKDPNAIQTISDTSFRVLYFFDADRNGIQHRLNQLKEELESVFAANSVPSDFSMGKMYSMDSIYIGTFIFAEEETDKGALEDILIPLMKTDNTDIFDAAETFLNMTKTSLLFKDKLIIEGETLKKVNGCKYNHNKSLVGTVGQLQKSGTSNTVCISDSDYLNTSKIKNNSICNSIYEFIKLTMNP